MLRWVPNTHSINVLMSHMFKLESRDACVSLMAKQAELLFTPTEYLSTENFVFEHCVVDSAGLWVHCAVIAGRQEERSLQLKLKTLTMIQGRPRLRDSLKSTLNDPARSVQVFFSPLLEQVDLVLNMWDCSSSLVVLGWSFMLPNYWMLLISGRPRAQHVGLVHGVLLQTSVSTHPQREHQGQGLLPGQPDAVAVTTWRRCSRRPRPWHTRWCSTLSATPRSPRLSR